MRFLLATLVAFAAVTTAQAQAITPPNTQCNATLTAKYNAAVSAESSCDTQKTFYYNALEFVDGKVTELGYLVDQLNYNCNNDEMDSTYNDLADAATDATLDSIADGLYDSGIYWGNDGSNFYDGFCMTQSLNDFTGAIDSYNTSKSRFDSAKPLYQNGTAALNTVANQLVQAITYANFLLANCN
ncbi:MAG: hypothetical protein GY906_04780 [bacterium]|nr:hypothetical protein [bacterium]